MTELQVSATHLRLARAQPLTPRAFEDLFRKLQRCPNPTELSGLVASGTRANDIQARAFAWAERENLLADFVQLILNKRLTPELIEAAKDAGLSFGSPGLQRLMDPTMGYVETGLHLQSFPICAAHVCRINIDGERVGTGFLVRPRIVATAYHVIDALIEPDGTPSANSQNRLNFEFGSAIVLIDGARAENQPQIVGAASDWLASGSPPHAEERQGRKPAQDAELDNHFDYALIRLASIVQLDLAGLPLERDFRLAAVRDEPMTILQHPRGRPLMHADAKALKTNEPAYRIAHQGNTENGSSGAPCFSRDAKVMAMHQSGPLNGPEAAPELRSNDNQCIPVHHWMDTLDALPVDTAGLVPIHKLTDGRWVVGRSELVGWLYDTITRSHAAPPILVVEPNGLRGLKYTVDIMKELLPIEQHIIHTEEVNDFIGANGAEVLDHLATQFGITLPAAHPEERLTAQSGHLRRKLVEDFLRALDADQSQTYWLVLDELERDRFGHEDGGALDALDLLFQKLRSSSRLRIVVLNRTDTRPVPLDLADVATEQIAKPDRSEVELLARMSGAAPPSLIMTPFYAAMLTAFHEKLLSFPQGKSYFREVVAFLEHPTP